MKTILEKHLDLVSIATRQRANFEGWLKFELARSLEKELGATDLEVEYQTKVEVTNFDKPVKDQSLDARSFKRKKLVVDMVFKLEGVKYWLQLKTPALGVAVEGVSTKKRNTATNMGGVTHDGKNLQEFLKKKEKEKGCLNEVALIAFAASPIPNGNKDGAKGLGKSLQTMMDNLQVQLNKETDCTFVENIPTSRGSTCRILVCCFAIAQLAQTGLS